jgi:hypothetical protein
MRPRHYLGATSGKPRLSRRVALGGFGGGMLGLAARTVNARRNDNMATPASGSAATPAATAPMGLTALAFQDSEFDGQFLRALDTIPYRGADTGECFTTARRIPDGDRDAWYDQWFQSGERVFAIAEQSRQAGHDVSARDAYLRA